MDKAALRQKRLDQRMKDAYEFGKRARQFTPQELLQQADDLISFARKLERSANRKKHNE